MLNYLYNPECARCSLSSTLEPNEIICVPGNGNWSSGYMIIGEAPGRNEALGGEPFIGRAGQLLDQALDKAGEKREHMFVSNVVKCRPPGNRRPNETEEAACKIYLEREIAAIKPSAILTLGNHALRAATGEWGVTRLAGIWLALRQPKSIIRVMPNYHPAYILRNRQLLPEFEKIIKEFVVASRNT